MRHYRTTTVEVDDIEVELEYNPEYFEPEIMQPTPDTLVVGYLLHDDDGYYCNPLQNGYANGDLFTYGERVITDNDYAPHYLGLNSFQGRGNWRHRGSEMDRDTDQDGIFEKVCEKVTAAIKADEDLSRWMVQCVMECDTPFEKLVEALVDDQLEGSKYGQFDWSSEEDSDMISLLPSYEDLANKAWDELYAEGKIGEYLAIPVSYCYNAHGPGTTQIYTTSIDDCNAVWIPGKDAIENMDFRECKTYADKLAVADKYASSVLKEYERWCNGEVYGYVVETFRKEGGEYLREGDPESCWGFIGDEWAEEAMKEQMNWSAKRFTEKEAA